MDLLDTPELDEMHITFLTPEYVVANGKPYHRNFQQKLMEASAQKMVDQGQSRGPQGEPNGELAKGDHETTSRTNPPV
jgi:hypothetical protein